MGNPTIIKRLLNENTNEKFNVQKKPPSPWEDDLDQGQEQVIILLTRLPQNRPSLYLGP
jgi:hypothetical protein